MTAETCRHFEIERKCPICQLEREVEALTAEREKLRDQLERVTAERDELRKPTRYALDSDGLCFVEGLGWVVRCCDAASYVARMLAQVAELKREQGEG